MDMESNHVEYYWENHCERQVKAIYDHYYQWYKKPNDLEEVFPVEHITSLVEFILERTDNLKKPIDFSVLNDLDNNPIFFDIASYAIFALDRVDNYVIDSYMITDILIRKQRDYGTKNIVRFGVMGIMFRMYDKVARLNNLMNKSFGDVSSAIHNNSVKGESIIDTLVDIVGYSTIALMLLDKDDQYECKFLVPMTPQETFNSVDSV
jgi:hypothetical protein